MIVRFTVDPAALLESIDNVLAHQRVLNIWRDHGVLLYNGLNPKESPLGRSIAQLPPALKTKWQKALKKEKITASTAEWSLARHTIHDDLVSISDDVDLCCVSSETACEFGVDSQKYCAVLEDPPLEIALFDAIDQSSVFLNATSISNGDIETDSDQEKLWNDRFKPIVHYSKFIVVIDRFCGEQLCDSFESGTATFIKRLIAEPSGVALRVYTQVSEHYGRDKVISAFRELMAKFPENTSRKFELFLGNSGDFKEAHPRTIRFDNVVVRLDAGLSLFGGDRVARHTTMSTRRYTVVSREHEETVRRFCFQAAI